MSLYFNLPDTCHRQAVPQYRTHPQAPCQTHHCLQLHRCQRQRRQLQRPLPLQPQLHLHTAARKSQGFHALLLPPRPLLQFILTWVVPSTPLRWIPLPSKLLVVMNKVKYLKTWMLVYSIIHDSNYTLFVVKYNVYYSKACRVVLVILYSRKLFLSLLLSLHFIHSYSLIISFISIKAEKMKKKGRRVFIIKRFSYTKLVFARSIDVGRWRMKIPTSDHETQPTQHQRRVIIWSGKAMKLL